jgi:hypothetical protein
MKDHVRGVHQTFIRLNESKFFVGILMIVMNIGSKYITVKMSNSQESYMRNNVAREVIIFCACWLGTRDIYISIILTASFFILTEHLFNEDSCLCVIPKRFRTPASSQTVTKEQLTQAMETVNRAVSQLK